MDPALSEALAHFVNMASILIFLVIVWALIWFH